MIGWLEKKRGIAFIITALIAIEIFYFSSLQLGGVGTAISWISVVYHFIVFFLFSFFLFVTIKGDKKIKTKYLVIVLVLSLIYALLDEFHQMFVPSRDANIKDILTDSLGVFISSIIYVYISKKKISNQQP